MRQITKEEFLEQSYQAFLKNAQLTELAKQRQEEEHALAAEYKVDEANSKRSAIIAKYRALEEPIKNDINELRKIQKPE